MGPGRVLERLRAGEGVPEEALRAFAEGLASGAVSDAQAGAFAMAVCLRGLTDAGRVALTEAMRDGGEVLHWDLDGPILDKHSTGGVGDCVSLLLAPALAACGAYVPMISGRGLGHTGGTLDKLESIPGLSTSGDVAHLRRVTGRVGCAIMGASARIAPADARLYAIRDVTGTVPSVDLIVASILSKKLAAGLGALVLDVKLGSGAFMKSLPEAEALARALVSTARGAGCRAAALITDMDEPLAPAMGNALEVMEVMAALTEGEEGDAWELACELGGDALTLGGLAGGPREGSQMIAEALRSGRAAETFGRMVAAQGGPADFLGRWHDRLPGARVQRDVPAGEAGYVAAIDGEALGRAVVMLGGGRAAAGARIDPGVGLSEILGIGSAVDPDSPLMRVHAASEEAAAAAALAVRAAVTIAETPASPAPLVRRRVG